MEVVIQFKEATENSLDVRNDPQSSWKYVENMYYMNIQLSPLSVNLFLLVALKKYDIGDAADKKILFLAIHLLLKLLLGITKLVINSIF